MQVSKALLTTLAENPTVEAIYVLHQVGSQFRLYAVSTKLEIAGTKPVPEYLLDATVRSASSGTFVFQTHLLYFQKLGESAYILLRLKNSSRLGALQLTILAKHQASVSAS